MRNNISLKDNSSSKKKSNDERYVLLCAMSQNDVPDAQKTAVEIASEGVQARVITCFDKKYDDIYRLAESGKCIFCGFFTHIPLPQEIVRRLCCKVRIYSFAQENDHDRREGERRSGHDRRKDTDHVNTSERLSGNDSGSEAQNTDRRAAERRSGKERRSGSQPDNTRRIYTVFFDGSFPDGERVRYFPKTNGTAAASLVREPDKTADETTAENKVIPDTLSSRFIALIIAAVLVIIYVILYIASFWGCIGPLY